MSDLKNVLKAGFLLTASLLATGCGDDKSSDNAGNGSGTDNGSIPDPDKPTVAPSTVRSSKFDLATFLVQVTKGTDRFVTIPVTIPKEGLETRYDVFGDRVSLASSFVRISPYNSPKAGGSLFFDATKLTMADHINLGGVLLDGSIDKNQRYTVPAVFKGNTSMNMFICRNATVTAAADDTTASPASPATIKSSYTYVGIDAAIGYDVLRQNQDGSEFEVRLDVHSQTDTSSATGLSADTPTATGLANTSTTAQTVAKLMSAATASKSKEASTVDNPAAQAINAEESVARAPVASKTGSVKLVTAKPSQLTIDILKLSGIYVTDKQGALDIAGRIATVEATDTVITAIGLAQPELINAPKAETKTEPKTVASIQQTDAKISAAKVAADKVVADALAAKTKADKAFDAATKASQTAAAISEKANSELSTLNKQIPTGGKLNKDLEARIAEATKAQAAAKTKADAAQKALDAATSDAKKASDAYADASTPAAKKTQATAKTVADASKATESKTAATQALIKDSAGKNKYFFTVKDGGLYAEIGDLIVGSNVECNAISGHALWAHNLTLKADLGMRVLADQYTLDKLTQSDLSSIITDGDKVGNGQKMMQILKDEGHSTQVSKVAEGGSTTEYLHYDSNTHFPLWVSASTPGSNKLVLNGVDLAQGVSLDTGVYAMPLVKDMSMALPNSSGNSEITLASDSHGQSVARVSEWKIVSNGYCDQVLLIRVVKDAPTKFSSDTLNSVLMSADVQAGRSVASSTLAGLVSKLDPSNLVSGSFANLSTSRINQAAQVASLTRGVSAANAEKLGAVEQYNVTFNYAGAQFGLSYNVEGGNAFSSRTGTTSFGANAATDMLGLKAIVSAEASVEAGKNAYAASSVASYNAGLTFAKAYSLGGLSVVPMGGIGVSSNALNSYSAVVPMAAGALGLSMNDVSFSAATFHAGVSIALDDCAAVTTGVNASLTLGVAGYLASTANATLSTSEGKSADLQFAGSAVTPYAQFSLGLASGEKLNTLISSGIVAINFGLDR